MQCFPEVVTIRPLFGIFHPARVHFCSQMYELPLLKI